MFFDANILQRAVSLMRTQEQQILETCKEISQTLQSHLRVKKLLAEQSIIENNLSSGMPRRVRGRRARKFRAQNKTKYSGLKLGYETSETKIASQNLDEIVGRHYVCIDSFMLVCDSDLYCCSMPGSLAHSNFEGCILS